MQISEKERTFIVLALETHIEMMHRSGCYASAVDNFADIQRRLEDVRNISPDKCDELVTRGQVQDMIDEAFEAEEPAADDDIVDLAWSLDDDQALTMYDALSDRLGSDPDEDEGKGDDAQSQLFPDLLAMGMGNNVITDREGNILGVHIDLGTMNRGEVENAVRTLFGKDTRVERPCDVN